jgi:hypothetical protein
MSTKTKSLSELVQAAGDPNSHESHVRRNRELQAKLSAAQADVKAERARREQAEGDLAVTADQLSQMLYTSDKINPTGLICINDLHCEKNIETDGVNGINTFNLDIASARIDRVFQKAVYMLDFSRKISNVRDAVLWLGGDIINGYIHEECQEGNFLGPAEATTWAADRLSGGINYLLKHGDLQQIIVPTSQGNHGRSTMKKRIATDYRSSWEFGMYNSLAREFRGNPRVVFKIERGYHNWVDIQGHGVRFHHGDSIKFGGGVGGVHIPLRKKIAQWNKMGKAPILDVLGHFHQFIDEWYYIVSGCLCGYDEYALHIGAEYQPPTQAFAVIDKDHGKVMALPIFCEAT